MKKNKNFIVLIMVMLIGTTWIYGEEFQFAENEYPKQIDSIQVDTKEVDIMFKQLHNYFLRNTIKLENDINVFTAQDMKTFDSLFGIAKTFQNKVTIPDFKKYSVIAIAAKASNIATAIIVNGIVAASQGIAVNISIKYSGEQSYTSIPMILIMIPKQIAGTNVAVIDGEMKLSTGTL